MYKEHCSNLKVISSTLKELENTIKFSIKTNNIAATKLHTNIHTFLTGAWIEVSLYKLIYGEKFNNNERSIILSERTLEDRWIKVLNIAFTKAAGIVIEPENLKIEDVKRRLERTDQHQYKDVLDFIQKDINEVISMRNKIAHGQWHYTFNSNVTSIDPKVQQLIHRNNYFNSRKRLESVKVIIEMIEKISVSPKTFHRDFNSLYLKLSQIPSRYTLEKYKQNCSNLLRKYKQGENWKKRKGVQ